MIFVLSNRRELRFPRNLQVQIRAVRTDPIPQVAIQAPCTALFATIAAFLQFRVWISAFWTWQVVLRILGVLKGQTETFSHAHWYV